MKRILLFTFLLAGMGVKAQAPTIAGDTMLCPWTDGTAGIVENTAYDSYQWYFKYWFLEDDFQPIDGADGPSFTYDWYTYDQAVFKVVVTQGDNTFESNTIQIDSWAWSGMTVIGEMGDPENVFFNPDTQSFELCEGTTYPNTVNSPYTANIQWYKDDVAIDGATSATYEIHEAGTYYVRASPAMCPDQEENVGQSMPIVVTMRADCTMGTKNPAAGIVALYPNPVHDVLTLELLPDSNFSEYVVIDVTGKILLNGKINDFPAINVAALATGTYLLKLNGDGGQATKKFIKQ
jgi:hypothetical protein